MGDNREYDVSTIFGGVFLITGGGKLQNIEDLSLVIHGYQLLPQQPVRCGVITGNFYVSGNFSCALLIVHGGYFQNNEYLSLLTLGTGNG